MAKAARINITGIVQGVGFRPFVYNLAIQHGITGFCLNDSSGVTIEASGENLQKFIAELSAKAPPLSKIDKIIVKATTQNNQTGFFIRDSAKEPEGFALISPDISVCEDCLKELFDPQNRRYQYPFINCTNCGPRYSIVLDIPYDRAKTTMAGFAMCRHCREEYENAANRRFHAEPIACEKCGPRAWLAKNGSGMELSISNTDAVKKTKAFLKDGAIIAIKGIGGFHLACDAENSAAVKKLREKKRKSNKPFAVMAADIDSARLFAEIAPVEERLLKSRIKPITLLKKKEPCAIADEVAPDNAFFGVMLAYTPLHFMLFNSGRQYFNALVMTSGNIADEPIASDNAEAFSKLTGVADYFLMHDRDIYMRVDDAITRAEGDKTRVLRRSRGYTPAAITLGEDTKDILACGAELKSAFCLTKNSHAIMSQHIGDLENQYAMEFFKETLKNLKNTFRAKPEIIAHDMHPDYLSTRFALKYAKAESIPIGMVVPVQHHHAHIASVMAEHGLKKNIIGIAFDGTGAGADGTLWGGEFLIANRKHFERKAHFDCAALPGGEMAIKEPWRMALSYLKTTFAHSAQDVARQIKTGDNEKPASAIFKMIDARLNSPLTSSAGRLFDAVSSLLGLCDIATFEAEAAIKLETAARRAKQKNEQPYGYRLLAFPDAPECIDVRPLIREIITDLTSGVAKETIAYKFHVTLAEIILDVSTRLRAENRINDVALSGGVFQNSLLCVLAQGKLSSAGFNVWLNEQVPANDGGVALGQATVAWERVKKYFC